MVMAMCWCNAKCIAQCSMPRATLEVRSHWTPPLGKYLPHVAPEGTMVIITQFCSTVIDSQIKVLYITKTKHLIPDWKTMIIQFTYLRSDPTCSMSITLFSSVGWVFVFFSSLGFSLTVVIKIGSRGHFKCFCSVNLSCIFCSIN